MAGLSTSAGPPVVNVYHEKSMILPDVSRVLTCLYEKNVKFETFKASYKDILSLQASRSVPVPFYDGPIFLQDSRAICRYIAETYEHQGYPFLLGKDVLERASIEQWLRNEEHAFDPPSRALFCHLAFPLKEEDDDYDDDINREKRKLEEVLEVYEQRLGETEFLAGNKFTLADLVHLPGTHHIITSERFAYLYDSRKNVQRWWNTISARDSWHQVLMDMKAVEEEHRKEELKKEQQQWQTEYLQPFSGRDIHISHRQQESTKSHTVLVPPPSTGTIITSIPSAPQEHETASELKPSSSIQRNEGGFFTTTEKHPPTRQRDPNTQKPPGSVQNTKSSFFQPSITTTTTKMDQRTDSDNPSQKGASTPSKTGQRQAGALADTKRATEADQDRAPSPAQKSGVQDVQKQAKAIPTEQKVSGTSPRQVESEEDTQDGTDGDERFSTKRLRRMFNPDAQGSQDPTMQEEAPVIKDPSGVLNREKQTTTVPANKITSSPSTGTRAPYTPEAADERGDISPPKGVPYNDRATARPGYSQSIQQVPPTSNDKLAKQGADIRTPQRASQQTLADAKSSPELMQGADPRARIVSDEQTKKSSTMTERAPEATRKASDSQGIQDTGDRDTNKKSIVGKMATEPTSETLGDKSTIAAMVDPSTALPAPVRTQASVGQNASVDPSEGNLDENSKNKAAKSSPDDTRSKLLTSPGKLAPNPDTQNRATSGQLSKPSPQLSSLSDTMNEETNIAETSQTSVVSPNRQPGGQAPRNTGVLSSVPPRVKPPEDNNKAYKEEAVEQVARDQSMAQLAENKKQGDYAAPVTRIGKSKEEGSLADASSYNMGQAQATTAEPSKLQIQSDQSKPQASKDGGKQTNETANSPTLATSEEVLPSNPEKSKQLQGDKSAITLQENVKQGSEAAPLGSGAEQQRKKDLPTNADKNYEKSSEVISEEKITSDTQQVKSRRNDSTSDTSIKPSQSEGNKDNLPESERRGT
ncbi:serine/arginine repetitive matrix protein 2 isoform X2 [Sorghum bicolor]|uniref:serine/arginine repetitive matrix protein 2 isoform X2 n=1 Tax=Sorghum bicolor TaxID=4558 RepID=UPI00081ADDBF|nr:serine/arginine repetitive matrix protein 2 isoform X2 [Sorghum bicolor]|eukprot:XP_021320101.1 serine/arginine repetitive matrix protein 2 isoform X2 [Sorghum bicolor]